jgi:hypothetical protein
MAALGNPAGAVPLSNTNIAVGARLDQATRG